MKKGFTFKARLMLTFLLLIFLFVVASAVSVYYGVQNDKRISIIGEGIIPDTLAYLELEKSVILIHTWLADISATRGAEGFDSGLENAKEAYDRGLEIIDRYIERAAGDLETVTLLEEMHETFHDFYATGTRMAQAYIEGGPDRGNELMSLFVPYAMKLHAYIDTLVEERETELEHSFEVLKKTFFNTSLIAIIITAGSAVVGVLLALLISRSISRPIQRIVEVTEDIARGDLTREVGYAKRNELGRLSANFNTAISQLRQLIHRVKDNSASTAGISEEVSSAATESSAALTQISANIASIKDQFDGFKANISHSTAAVEEIGANIDSLDQRIEGQSSLVTESSSSIEEMISSINNVAKIAQARGEAAKELVEVTVRGGEKIDTTNTIVSEVSGLAEKMIEITGIIKTISNQTNLLSMNASSEAAHAGEFGKGFAVVADEIRKLAESTAENSKTISTSLQSAVEKINLALTSSGESRQAFEVINREVNEFTDALTEIGSSMSEMALGSQEVLKAISELSQITQEIKQGSGEIKAGAKDVNKTMQDVHTVSMEVSGGIDEIDIASKDIANAMVHLADLSNKSNETIDQLNQEVARFKV